MTEQKSTAIPVMLQAAAASLAGVILGVALRQAVDGASASHPFSPHAHVSSINSYAEFETYCAWALDDSITQPDALQRVRVVGESRWADIRWVEFAGDETACDDPNNQTYRIYFYTDSDINWSQCGAGKAGCASTVGLPKFDPAAGHDDWPTWEVDLDTYYLSGLGIAHGPTLINHEVGHVLGLVDDQEDTACAVPSIMHGPSIGNLCSDVPTDADAATVLSLEPSGSTGWNNFSKIW